MSKQSRSILLFLSRRIGRLFIFSKERFRGIAQQTRSKKDRSMWISRWIRPVSRSIRPLPWVLPHRGQPASGSGSRAGRISSSGSSTACVPASSKNCLPQRAQVQYSIFPAEVTVGAAASVFFSSCPSAGCSAGSVSPQWTQVTYALPAVSQIAGTVTVGSLHTWSGTA